MNGASIFVKMKKVLIITYYWPPSGGSGVQRWLKFTKYLPQFGWQPFVFTPENPSFEVKDPALEKDISPEVEVLKLPIWEPYVIFEKFKGKGSQQSDLVRKKKKSLFSRFLLWVRGNFFIPDPRIFWVKPAAKVLEDIILANKIDVVITTGPPHSIHLIGLKLKKKLGVKWVADFRDPWTTWILINSFYLSVFARRQHQKLERNVLKNASAVIAASRQYAQELTQLGGRNVEVITNGFDEAEFAAHNKEEQPEEFFIRHVGVVDELRDPRSFLHAIQELAEEGDPVKVEFIGNVNVSLQGEIAANEVLNKLISFKPYVSHDKVFQIYQQSAVLLLIPFQDTPGNIPGKLFEYLASQRPVLFVGPPEGDAAAILRETNAGIVCETNDTTAIKDAVRKLKAQYSAGISDQKKTNISQYSRVNLTEKLAETLNAL